MTSLAAPANWWTCGLAIAGVFRNLSRIEPRASLELVIRAGSVFRRAIAGKAQRLRHAQDDDSAAAEYELLAPRSWGETPLTSQQSTSLGAGQLGVVSRTNVAGPLIDWSYLCTFGLLVPRPRQAVATHVGRGLGSRFRYRIIRSRDRTCIRQLTFSSTGRSRRPIQPAARNIDIPSFAPRPSSRGHSGTSQPAFVRDISPTGIGLLHALPLDPGLFQVCLPGRGDQPQRIPVQVTWRRPAGRLVSQRRKVREIVDPAMDVLVR